LTDDYQSSALTQTAPENIKSIAFQHFCVVLQKPKLLIYSMFGT